MSDDARAAAAAAPPSAAREWLVDLFVVAVAALLIFTRLGVYPLWGDEADTVIFARSIWETGDMNPWYEGNLYAYRDAAQLTHLKNRSAPPLPFYVTAPFWGLAGLSTFWLRFPFAACGVGVVALMQYAWRRLGFTAGQRLLIGLALACNTSFLLYSRQCRYYALATLFSVAFVLLYATYDGSRKRLAALVGVGSLLIATQFMNFAALMAALLVDYVGWNRHRRKLSVREWLGLLVPLGIVFAAMVYVFNPVRHDLYPANKNPSYWHDRLVLAGWAIRDANLSEYWVGTLMFFAPLVGIYQGLRRGDWLLLRLLAASAAFFFVTICLMPQPIDWTREADIRYMVPLIVTGTAASVLVIWALAGSRFLLAAPLVAVVVFSNVVHLPLNPERWRYTLVEYVRELNSPRQPASAVLGRWLNENVSPGSWAGFAPTDWLAPQLLLAPHVRYGWQLATPPSPEDFADQDPRMWQYRAPVDLIIILGFSNLRDTFEKEVLSELRKRGQFYEPWAELDVYYDDRTRPELIWHWFRDQGYDKQNNGIYIYRRTPSPAPAP